MNLMDLVIGITVDDSDAEKGIDSAKGKANKGADAISKGIGKALKTVGKVAAAATGAAATGLVALSKQAISAYGNYEQLVGGVETLFGTGGKSIGDYAKSVGKSVNEARKDFKNLQVAQDTVMKNASVAFKTAGLSANGYMETVTSFSASLISSLGGDTVKAAEVADMAIIDMSDNANKMGTSMESIQNAYQGFAKQNYTMLDNLKLGYGGTKQEMERLLEDAEAIKKANGEMADYSIDSFADIVEAIHVIQDEMDISGTTAKEASTTIQGSISMMKASWENFMTAMADPNGNIDEALDNLIESVVTVAENIGPKLITAIPNIVNGLMQLVDGLMPYVGPMLDELLPEVVNGAITLIEGLAEQLPTIIDTLFDTVYDAFSQLFTDVWEALPPDIQDALTNLKDAFDTLGESLQPITDMFTPLIDNVTDFITGAKDGKTATDNFKDAIDTVSSGITSLADGISSVIDFCTEYQDILIVLTGVIAGLVGGIGAYNAVVLIQQGIETVITALMEADTAAKIANAAATLAAVAPYVLIGAAIGAVIAIIVICIKHWDEIKAKVTAVASSIKNTVTEKFNAIKTTIGNVMSGIKDKISSTWDGIKDKIRSAIDTIKGMMNFSWSLPNLRLPHFTVTGGQAPWGFMGQGSLPKVSVSWYAKAMNNPLLMDSATIFGMAKDGTLLGGGEKGQEVVSGTSTLMTMIADAVEGSNSKVLNSILAELQTLNSDLYGTIATATENIGLNVNDREFARMVHKYA